jgi:nitrogen regulatory protein P-II 1
MTKIEAIIRVDAVETVIEKLDLIGVSGITKTEVEGHGKQKGIVEQFRGKEYRLPFIPKIKLEMVVKDLQVDDVINTVINCCQTGEIGDGKIFISEIKDAIRVRTGERGEKAI